MCRWRGCGFQAIWSGKGYGFQTIWSGKEYGFQAIWSGIGSSNHSKLVSRLQLQGFTQTVQHIDCQVLNNNCGINSMQICSLVALAEPWIPF